MRGSILDNGDLLEPSLVAHETAHKNIETETKRIIEGTAMRATVNSLRIKDSLKMYRNKS